MQDDQLSSKTHRRYRRETTYIVPIKEKFYVSLS